MKLKKATLTIGIPAYNEEANIASLLRSLLNQKENIFSLKKIIVYSDASSDRTAAEVKTVRSKKIEYIESKKRVGKPTISNYFFKHSTTDILVIIDADVLLKGSLFLQHLVQPIVKAQADLTSAKVLELPSQTFVENVLQNSMEVKRSAFESYNEGNNLYTCHGRARAFSRNFYRNYLANPDVSADDAYSYIMCVQMGYTYQYAPKAALLYRLPQNLKDHFRQSTRFFQGEKQLLRYFPHATIEKYFALPFKTKVSSLLQFALNYPTSFVAYIGILLFSKLHSFQPTTSGKWNAASSSKVLR